MMFDADDGKIDVDHLKIMIRLQNFSVKSYFLKSRLVSRLRVFFLRLQNLPAVASRDRFFAEYHLFLFLFCDPEIF